MKIAITADVHFDVYLRYSTILSSGLPSRLDDAINCWAWINETAIGFGCKKLFVLGDLFNARTGIDTIVLYHACNAIAAFAQTLPPVLIPGNHDCPLRSPQMHSVAAMLGTATVIDKPSMVDDIALVPWYDNPDDIAAGVDSLISHKPRYLFTHGYFQAAGQGRGMKTDILQPSKFKGVYLGDVHNPISIAPNVKYVGAPWQIDYRDAGQPRGFYVLDTKTGKDEFVENLLSRRFHLVTDVIPKIQKGDVVRVVSEDSEQAVALAAECKEQTNWVETDLSEAVSISPRMSDVRTSSAPEEAWERYVRHEAGAEALDELIALGADILKAVQ